MLDVSVSKLTASLLECHPFHAAIVRTDGVVCIANSKARATFERRDGLEIISGQLQGHGQEGKMILGQLLSAKASTTTYRLTRQCGGIWLLRTSHLEAVDQPAGVQLVSWLDPDEPLSVNPELFRVLFGLSPAECRLASHLGDGIDLRDAAASLGVCQDTAKTHLKSIFRKTGVHRQRQLVRTATLLGLFC